MNQTPNTLHVKTDMNKSSFPIISPRAKRKGHLEQLTLRVINKYAWIATSPDLDAALKTSCNF